MGTIIQLIAILVLGYLSAHYIIGRLQTRFFILTGIEYILLGVLVGPHVTNVMTPEVVNQLSPIMTLSIGSLGLLYGLKVKFRDLLSEGTEALRLTLVEVLVTFLLVGGAFAAVFLYAYTTDGGWLEALPAALALGAAATVSTPSALDAVRKRFAATGPLPDLLQFVVRYDRVLGIILFGLIFCFFHQGETQGIRALTSTEWVAVNIGFGIILGLLFFLFLGRDRDKSKLFVALIGLVVFSSGVAYYLHLSPLFINLILGMMLANTSSLREELIETLESIEQPVFVVVLVFAGAAWNINIAADTWVISLAFAAAYFGLRFLGKQAGGYLTYTTSEIPEQLSPRVGSGLMAQGGVAVAMVVTYSQVYQNTYTNIVVTCVIVSVILSEFIGPKLAKDMLVDAEQITVAEKVAG